MLLLKIKKILKHFYIRYKSYSLSRIYYKKYEFISILGNSYKVVKGTFQSRSDYDDAWLLFLSQKANIVFDIGCHTGKSALIISQSNLIERLVLIDPNPLSLSLAAENLIINNISQNAIFIAKAASFNSGDKIKLWTMHGAFSGASTDINFTETGMQTKKYFDVETITLDKIAETYNLYPDLVKIDVEGSEHSVLLGAHEIAKIGDAKFIVEVHSCEKMNIMELTDKILSWCKKYNYKAYYLCKHIEIKDSKAIEGRGRYHLLLVHRDTKYPDGLNKIEQATNIETIKEYLPNNQNNELDNS